MPKLMIPGPTEVSNKVLEKMKLPVRHHYGDEFVRLFYKVNAKLKKVFKTNNELFILAATSSAAMETAVAHAVEPGEQILICINGFFGERFEEIAHSLCCKVITINKEYGQPIEADDVLNAINENPKIKAMAIVHNETSTAVQSDLKSILAITKEKGVLTIVDSVSSMGGVDVRTDELGIDFCISGSQKCFGSVAGLSFLSVSKSAWDSILSRKEPVRSWYLNLNILKEYREKWHDWHPQGPNTAVVSLYIALDQALDEIFEEGLENRFERHIRASNAFRGSMRAMGLELFSKDHCASKTVTSICLPEGIDGSKLRENILNKHDILLSGGIAELKNKMIRIGHMSKTASDEYLIPTIQALEEVLSELGAKINRGVAVEAFKNIYDKSPDLSV